jgi:hypothetical protein
VWERERSDLHPNLLVIANSAKHRVPSLGAEEEVKTEYKTRTQWINSTIKSMTCTSPFRFDIFVPSGLSKIGRWANCGGRTSSAEYRSK